MASDGGRHLGRLMLSSVLVTAGVVAAVVWWARRAGAGRPPNSSISGGWLVAPR